MQNYNVIIIGGGAAGLMCALTAGQRKQRVLVLDHANKVGKKILMSGGGRCNFTNTDTSPEKFISHNPQFCKSALSRYKPEDFIKLVEKHRVKYHEKTPGQLFCTDSAKDIVNLLLAECSNADVEIKLNTRIETIEKNAGYTVTTNQGEFNAESLVIATGGLSIPTMGATPLGYKIAEQFGLKIWPTRAGLVPFTLHEQDKLKYAELSGIAVNCTVETANTLFNDAMLFTHRGLSGPAMLQISSYWTAGQALKITLEPSIDLYKILLEHKSTQPKHKLKNLLANYFPKKLVDNFLKEEGELTLANLKDNKLSGVADLFQTWLLKPNATEGYRTAEVTLGGVDCNELSSQTFEVKSVPNLYFIGEVLDVTGHLGGYNFQWAWASGHAAGLVA